MFDLQLFMTVEFTFHITQKTRKRWKNKFLSSLRIIINITVRITRNVNNKCHVCYDSFFEIMCYRAPTPSISSKSFRGCYVRYFFEIFDEFSWRTGGLGVRYFNIEVTQFIFVFFKLNFNLQSKCLITPKARFLDSPPTPRHTVSAFQVCPPLVDVR